MQPGIEPGLPCHDQSVPCRWAIRLLDPVSPFRSTVVRAGSMFPVKHLPSLCCRPIVAGLDGEIDQHQGVGNVSTPWIKTSRSNEQGSCVEQRCHDGMIEARDSKKPLRPGLTVHPRRVRGVARWCTNRASSIICF